MISTIGVRIILSLVDRSMPWGSACTIEKVETAQWVSKRGYQGFAFLEM